MVIPFTQRNRILICKVKGGWASKALTSSFFSLDRLNTDKYTCYCPVSPRTPSHILTACLCSTSVTSHLKTVLSA